MYEYVVVEHLQQQCRTYSIGQQSTTQSALHKAANKLRADQSATTYASRQSWREPACRRAFHTAVFLLLTLIFPFLVLWTFFKPVYSSSNMYDAAVEHLQQYCEHSTAQHSAITPVQSSKPSTCRSEYISKQVCKYMHATSGLFSWSMELLAFASHLFAPKMLDLLLFSCIYMPFRSIHPCERA